eukprot:898587-Rhodomonas_salina.1
MEETIVGSFVAIIAEGAPEAQKLCDSWGLPMSEGKSSHTSGMITPFRVASAGSTEETVGASVVAIIAERAPETQSLCEGWGLPMMMMLYRVECSGPGTDGRTQADHFTRATCQARTCLGTRSWAGE